jgi:hypothetical protein
MSEYINTTDILQREPSQESQRSFLLIRLLRFRKEFVEAVLSGKNILRLNGTLLLWALLFFSIYGASMGLYANVTQLVYSAIKLPLLFLGTLLICYPPLYLLTVLIGAEIGFFKTFNLALSSLVVGAFFLALLTPVSLLFTLSHASREVMTLIHALAVSAACLVMVVYLYRIFSDVSEFTPLYPAHVRRVLGVWIFLLAFVGGQAAWLLLPFVGDENRATEFLRSERGNATLYRELKLNFYQIWRYF